ncbi:four helix bundle protein [Streptomyces hokutonensis]|uniref:four helix bundle protein n=1 Tax=Streptomyces hokutonensis TaxID=1306990 RepID=UPI0038095860
MPVSIQQLRIYREARELEDQVYELVKKFPVDEFYDLGNVLRRESAAVSHHIMEAHRLISYRYKIDALDNARREAISIKHSIGVAEELGVDQKLIESYEGIAQQCLSLSEWLQGKLEERLRKTCQHLEFTDTLDGHKCGTCGLEWTEEEQARLDAA